MATFKNLSLSYFEKRFQKNPVTIQLYYFYEQKFRLNNSMFLKSPLPFNYLYSPLSETIFSRFPNYHKPFQLANKINQKQKIVLERLKDMIAQQTFALSQIRNNLTLTQKITQERESIQALYLQVKKGEIEPSVLDHILSILPEEKSTLEEKHIDLEQSPESALLPTINQKPKLNVLYISDIHSEYFSARKLERGITFLGYTKEEVLKADVIIIAGDLGTIGLSRQPNLIKNETFNAFIHILEDFLTLALEKDIPVFLIAGNHEFYHGEYKTFYQFLTKFKEQKIEQVRERQSKVFNDLEKWKNRHALSVHEILGKSIYENLFILQDHFIELEKFKVAIFASTFWTSAIEKGIPKPFSSAQTHSQDALRDFKRIQVIENNQARFISPQDFNTLNNNSLNSLKKCYFENLKENYTFIVVSHHLPTQNGFAHSLKPNFGNNYYSHFYYSPIWEYLAVNHIHVDYWIHGHFHFSPPSYLMANQEMLKELKQKLAFDIVQKYKQQGNFYAPKKLAPQTSTDGICEKTKELQATFEELKTISALQHKKANFATLKENETLSFSTENTEGVKSQSTFDLNNSLSVIENFSVPTIEQEDTPLHDLNNEVILPYPSATLSYDNLENEILADNEEYNPELIKELQNIERMRCDTVVLSNCFGYIKNNLSPLEQEANEFSIFSNPVETCYKQITAFEPKTYLLPLVKIQTEQIAENICQYVFNQYLLSYQSRHQAHID